MASSVLPREPDGRSESVQRTARAQAGQSTAFRLARALYGSVLAVMALDNFLHLHQRVGYAQSKDAPAPRLSVPFISGALLSGSLGLLFWKLPTFAAGAVATFFVSVTPQMHDFWNLDDPTERQQQRVHFLKNTALLGGALAFMKRGAETADATRRRP